ncbi:unnamed protein product [Pleuronectes platessa]|uniref:Uncharacterized protein n=1 Tax=Pleuronectes platessa TaxID=8262 RepID=A0A9N7YHH5_PLEPL|nr:unnamed protein product [Pleuronectes platessa]
MGFWRTVGSTDGSGLLGRVRAPQTGLRDGVEVDGRGGSVGSQTVSGSTGRVRALGGQGSRRVSWGSTGLGVSRVADGRSGLPTEGQAPQTVSGVPQTGRVGSSEGHGLSRLGLPRRVRAPRTGQGSTDGSGSERVRAPRTGQGSSTGQGSTDGSGPTDGSGGVGTRRLCRACCLELGQFGVSQEGQVPH